MKNNSGVTLVALIVMVIVIIILASVFIATGLDSLTESKNAQIVKEIHSIEQAITVKYASYIKNEGNVVLPGKLAKNELSSIDECLEKVLPFAFDSEEKIRVSSDIEADYDKFIMIINPNDKKKLELENYSNDTTYIVDYRAGWVYGPIGL